MGKDRTDEPVNRKRAISLKLTVLTRQLHKRFDQRVASIGVTRSQWTMIAVISRYPGATQRQVAERLEMSEASAGRLIDRLLADGLLMRRPKEDDRRAHCIHLTDSAREILETISAIAVEHENAVFEGFSPDDLERLDAYLDLMAANSAASD